MKIYFFSLLLLFSCSNQDFNKKPQVVVTLSPYDIFIKEIVQDKLKVSTLLSPSFSCHEIEPSLKDLSLLLHTDLWICLGEPFEKKMITNLKEKNPSLKIFEISHQNTHRWLSPKKLSIDLIKIEKIISHEFPQFSSIFESNLKIILSNLKKLDETVERRLSSYSGIGILEAHPTLFEFCKDYNLKLFITDTHGDSPTGKDLTTLWKKISKESISLAIAIPQSHSRSISHLSKMMNLPLFSFDPFNPNYFENIYKLCDYIERSFQEKEISCQQLK